MFIVIFSLVLIFFSLSPIQAYTYSSYIDIENLPLPQVAEDSIYYDEEEIEDNMNKISVPPGSRVKIGIEGNFSDYICNVRIFLSKDNIYQGDLTKMLNIFLPYGELSFIKNGKTTYRYGRIYSLDNISLENGRNDLLTLSVLQPLDVLEYSYTVLDDVVSVKTVVKNVTDEILNNVEYMHDEFSLTRNFEAGEEFTYEYTLEYDSSNDYADLGFPRIYNPNIRQICAAGIYTAGNPHNIFLINNGNVYYDIGTSLDEDFCITRIGYSLNLGKITVGNKGEVIENDEGLKPSNDFSSDSGDDGDTAETVLGLQTLPKTLSYSAEYILLGIFLVAFGILCYYFTDENTSCNS